MQFEPHNPLELALCDAQAGNTPLTAFLQKLLDSEIAIPSSEEVQPDGRGMSPVCFDKNGIQMVASFTKLSRANTVSNLATYCITMRGRELLARMPLAFGLVINPGFSAGLDITRRVSQEILREFPALPGDSSN